MGNANYRPATATATATATANVKYLYLEVRDIASVHHFESDLNVGIKTFVKPTPVTAVQNPLKVQVDRAWTRSRKTWTEDKF